MRNANANKRNVARAACGLATTIRTGALAASTAVLLLFATVILSLGVSTPQALAESGVHAASTVDVIGTQTSGAEGGVVETDIGFATQMGINSNAAPMGLMNTQALGSLINSAYLSSFTITKDGTTPIVNATTSDSLIVNLKWGIDDISEINSPGDYIEIQLPENMLFNNASGEYIYGGSAVATYQVADGKVRVAFTERGINSLRLDEASGKIPLVDSTFGFGRMTLHGARFAQAGEQKARAEITKENQGGNDGIETDTINVTVAAIRALTDTKIDSVEMSVDGVLSSEFSYYDLINFELSFSRNSMMTFIRNGDYFDVSLPAGFVYGRLDTRFLDESGTVVHAVTMHENGADKLRITFEYVTDSFNWFNVKLPITAVFSEPNDGMVSTTGTAQFSIVDGTSFQSVQYNVKVNKPPYGDETDIWYMQPPWYADAQVREKLITAPAGNLPDNGTLWVLAPRPYNAIQLDPHPYGSNLNNPDLTVNWNPNANYIVAYCSDLYTQFRGQLFGSYTRYTLDNAPKVNDNSFVSENASKLKTALSVSYPYISLEEMIEVLKPYAVAGEVPALEQASYKHAIAAVQVVLWEYVHKMTFPTQKDATVKAIVNAMRKYVEANENANIGESNYEFESHPTFEYDSAKRRMTVSGSVTPAPGSGVELTGRLSSEGSASRQASFIVDANGSFRVTLEDVDEADRFELSVSGQVKKVDAYYYVSGGSQSLISGYVTTTPFSLSAVYQGSIKTNITVKKAWKDKNGNVMATLPNKSVSVSLYRNGEFVGSVATLTKGNGFTHTWSDLPLLDSSGEPYAYTVHEDPVAGYEQEGIDLAYDATSNAYVFTITNKEKPKETDVRVVKVDGETEQPLEGAKFCLYTEYVPGEGATTDMTPAPFCTCISGEGGVLNFPSLEYGRKYWIEEFQSPSGYKLPQGWKYCFKLTRTSDGLTKITMLDSPNVPDASAPNGGVEVISRNGNLIEVRIKNEKEQGYTLPETGGRGFLPFAFAGGAIMAFAAGMFRRRRRSSR